MEDKERCTQDFDGERDHLIDRGVDGRTILKWIFEKWNGRHGLDRSGSR